MAGAQAFRVQVLSSGLRAFEFGVGHYIILCHTKLYYIILYYTILYCEFAVVGLRFRVSGI